MHRYRSLVAVALAGITVACSDRTMTSSDGSAHRGSWGSADASLVVTGTGATVQFLAGSCYGSYGTIPQVIPAGPFVLSGTFTQLVGAYPGRLDYAAQFSGTVVGDQMTFTVTVSGLQRVVGPFTLVYGVQNAWPQCLYPVRASRKSATAAASSGERRML